jgi:aldose 1-epimerase
VTILSGGVPGGLDRVPTVTENLPLTATRPPTGLQYEISLGRARARVGSVAAVLREFSVDGQHYTEIWDDNLPAPYGCGIVLAPWPNRIKDAQWEHEGKTLKLDMTDRGNNAAIHGLLRNTSYELVEIDDVAVTLGATIYPQHGYPFTVDTFVTYRLTDQGLQVTHRLANVGGTPAPFGIGAHPYLRVGDHPIKDLRITLNADTFIPIDDNKIPTGRSSVDRTDVDLRDGVRLDAVSLDTAYTDLHPEGDQHLATLTAPDGTGLVLWADLVFGYIQVFTPRDYPGRELTVAIEPMTCPANAFNSGEALRWLAPGESFEASWGLRPVG